MARKPPSKKQMTHSRMLSAASQGFRSRGYAGVGVDGIAKAAGVTSGAFYAHFGSKDGAFSAALHAGLDEVIERLPQIQRESGSGWIEAFVAYYLGQAHRNDLPCGCAIATLSPEVVRAGPEVHAAYENKMKKIADIVANGLAGGSDEQRRERAWAMLGILVGGLTLARAVKTRKAAEGIATAIKHAALQIAGDARDVDAESH